MPSTPAGFEQLRIDHIGFVVDDLPRAAALWAQTYGAGPFFLFAEMEFEELTYLEQPFAWRHSAAYGRFGALAVELQTFAFPEPMPELEARISPGLNKCNHICYVAADVEEASAKLTTLGYPRFLQGRNGDHHFYWHDARHSLGHCVEISNDSDSTREFRTAMSLVSQDWHGEYPLRAEPPPGVTGVMNDLITRR